MAKYSNVVRFRVKQECIAEFENAFRDCPLFDGMLSQLLIRTGDGQYCGIGFWDSEDALVSARPEMIAFLDKFRDLLEEISPEVGVTDAVSGPVIVDN
jgi:hypothetical protein